MLQRRPLPPKKKTADKSCSDTLPKFSKGGSVRRCIVNSTWDDIKINKQAQLELNNCLKPLGPDPFPYREARKFSLKYKAVEANASYNYEFPFDSQFFNETSEKIDENEDHVSAKVPARLQSRLNFLNLNDNLGLEFPNDGIHKPWRLVLLEHFKRHARKSSEQFDSISPSITNALCGNRSLSISCYDREAEEILSSLTSLVKSLSEEEGSLCFEEFIQLYPEESQVILNSISSLSSVKPEVADEELKEDISEFAFDEGISADGNTLTIKAFFVDQLPKMKHRAIMNLKHANLSFNDFKEIPSVLMAANDLLTLNMRNNPISALPNNMHLLEKLTNLNLSFCCIAFLDKSLFMLTNLQSLDLSYNLLIMIPEEVGLLRSLKELNVDGNNIKYFPASILKLNISVLHLNLNYTNKVFWKFTTPKIVLKLSSICKHVLVSNNLYNHDDLSKASICGMCLMKKPYDGINMIKPISNIFNVKHLPVLFSVCSQECRRKLLDAERITNI